MSRRSSPRLRQPKARDTRQLRLTAPQLLIEHLESRYAPSANDPLLSALSAGLPLSFEPNQGQTDAQVDFLSRGPGYGLFLTPTQATLSLLQPGAPGAAPSEPAASLASMLAPTVTVVRMDLVGGNPAATAAGLGALEGRSNYFVGDTAIADIPTYGQVKYAGVYSGIDLVYHGNAAQQLQYDFIVAPGANPGQIRLSFPGAALSLDDAGNLIIQQGATHVVNRAPFIYQDTAEGRQQVAGSFVLLQGSQVAFEIGAYDAGLPLVIDPTLNYATYLGGSGVDQGFGIAVDAAGNSYVTGLTSSSNFPTVGALDATANGNFDVFITKINATGTSRLYSTYLGGSGDDRGFGIAIDPSGNAYVTGMTQSGSPGSGTTNFPIVNGRQTAHGGGTWDGFVSKINAAGNSLLYSTYLGGSADDNNVGLHGYNLQTIAADASGNAYVTGMTVSSDFPTTATGHDTSYNGSWDGFFARINTTLSGAASLTYSTYYGGASDDRGQAIAIDAAGNAYLTGFTFSARWQAFPITADAFQGEFRGNWDTFVAKFNPATSGAASLVYSTYLGSYTEDFGQGIAVDAAGNAYVTGLTNSTADNFPVTNAIQAAPAGNFDVFITKLNPAGSALVYSTYYGGAGDDRGQAIAVDAAGNAHITGLTASTAFPIANAVRQHHSGGFWDGFVLKLNAAGDAPYYSTYFGGSGDDRGNGIALDAAGNAYVAGMGWSSNLPGTAGTVQPAIAGDWDAFVFKLSDTGNHAPVLPNVGTVGVEKGATVTLDLGAQDPDTGATVTHSIDNLPPGAVFDPITGALSWTPPPTDAAGWWPGAGNASDVAGGHHGTLQNGTTFGAGTVGRAFSFDGVDDVVNVGDHFDMGSSDFTLEAWIKGDPTMENWGRILDKGYASGFTFGRRGITGQVGFEFLASGSQGNDFATTSVVIDNTWHHVAVVKEGNVARIYADGVLENTQTVSTASQENALPLLIGYNPGEGIQGHWKGELDDIGIFSRALSSAEIQAIHAAGSFGKGMVGVDALAKYSAEGNANEGNFGFDGTLQGNANFASGQVGQAFSFDGDGDYILIGDVPALHVTGNTFAIEGWINAANPNNGTGNYQIIVNMEGEYELAVSPTGTLAWAIANTSPGWVFVDTGYAVPANQWIHVAVSYDVNVIRTFVDGVLVHTQAGSGVIGDANASLDELRIGGRQNSALQHFAGMVDELAIYNRALSAADVQSIYQAGATGSAVLQSYSKTFTVTANDGVAPPAPLTGLVSSWKGEGNATDSADGNHGALQNGATFAPGLFGQAFSFDGINDFVLVNNAANLNPTTALTLSAWLYTSNPNQSGDLIGKDGETSNRQYLLNLVNGRLRAHITGSSGVFSAFDGVTTIAPNTWYHVAMTYDNATLRLYVNGNLDGSLAVAGPAITTTQPVRLGGGAPAGAAPFHFQGLLDEPAIYNRALSAAEVTSLYTARNSDSKTVTIAVSNPTPTLGSALHFDGAGNYLETPASTLFGDFSQLTYEFWFRPEAVGGNNPPGTGSSTFLISNHKPVNGADIGIEYFNDGTLSFLLWNAVGGIKQVSTTFGADQLNEWHHIAGAFDGASLKLYVDGALAGTTTATRLGNVGSRTIMLGAALGPTDWAAEEGFFKGAMDEVRVWNVARTQSQIAGNRESELKGSEPGLIGYWRFNEGAGPVAYDATANHFHAALGTGAAAPAWVASLGEALGNPRPTAAGNALRLDGINDFVQVPHSASLHSDRQVTISGWFKVDGFVREWQNIFFKGNADGAANREYSLWVGSSGFLHAVSSGAAGSTYFLNTNSGMVQPGRWHHFALVVDADNYSQLVYLDGELRAQGVFDGSGIRNTGGVLRFGKAVETWDNAFDGSLDEIRIHNVARTQAQIRADMHQTVPANQAGLQGYWKFDEASGGTALDATLNNNHGTFAVEGGITQNVAGALGGDTNPAYQFSAGQIAVSMPQLNTEYGDTNTVSFWMYWDGTNLVTPVSFSNYGLILWNGHFGFNTFQSDVWGISSAGLDNRWVHVAAVFNNGNAKLNQLYIDGVAQTLTQRLGSTSTSVPVVNGIATISGQTTVNDFWDDVQFRGKLDEVAFFNRTLTAAEVAAQFAERNTGNYASAVAGQAAVGYYRLGETTGTVVLDSSGNGNTGVFALSREASTTPLFTTPPAPVIATVTNTFDSGPGSLRQVLTEVNALGGVVPVTINFAIPVTDPNFVDADALVAGGDPAADVFVIQPLSPLPVLVHGNVTIDGRSQTTFGGDTNPFGPEIVLDGQHLSDFGLQLNNSGNIIAGLTIQRFKGDGIAINNSADNLMFANYIGTDATGRAGRGNTWNGVQIIGGHANVIGTDGDGDDDVAERNIISGNGAAAGGAGVAVNGVPQGIDQLGKALRMIAGELPSLSSTATIAQADIWDTTNPAPNNNWSFNHLVPGGGGDHYAILGLGTLHVSTAGTFSFALSGDDGGRLRVDGVTVIVDDSLHPPENRFGSIFLSAGPHQFEWVGFENGGWSEFELSVAVGAVTGAATTALTGPTWKVLGDPSPHEQIHLDGSILLTVYYAATENTIAGNYIGANVLGTGAIANVNDGVLVSNVARGTIIGTDGDGEGDVEERNVISGNLRGIRIQDSWGTSHNVVAGNYIGTSASGLTTLANTGQGINIQGGARHNRIGTDGDGSSDALERNVISGNTNVGILINGAGADFNVVAGNYIGLNKNGTAALGNNGAGGVRLLNGPQFNIIGTNLDGAADDAEGNVISGNIGTGIGVRLEGAGTSFNTVAGNFIGTDKDGNGLALGATAWFRAENTTTNTVGSGTGTLQGNALFTGGGMAGAAFTFDGAGDYVSYGDILDQGSGSFTLEAWINPASAAPAGGAIVAKGHTGTSSPPDVGYELRIVNGKLDFSVSSGSELRVVSAAPMSLNEWHHVVGVMDRSRGRVQIYIDGVSAGELSFTTFGSVDNNLSFTIGALDRSPNASVVEFFHGLIDEVSVYNRPLTAAEIQFIHARGSLGKPFDLGNSTDGVRIEVGASGNTIGGVVPAARNVIAGNNGDGIEITSAAATGNRVQGNYIGVSADSNVAVGNSGQGIFINTGAANNTIGGAVAGAGNVVSGNASSGILISAAAGNIVAGNFIGTNATGSAAVPNSGVGIRLDGGSTGNRIGSNGDNTGDSLERNIISGNMDDGIRITGAGTNSNSVAGNYIGVDAGGAFAISNLQNGVRVTTGPQANRIGTDGSDDNFNAAERNLISGNVGNGVQLDGAAANLNIVAGNYIGTNAAGTDDIANAAGVRITTGAQANRIGTDGNGVRDADERNLISGNRFQGVVIASAGSDQNLVAGNYIGTDLTGAGPLANQQQGVAILTGAKANRIEDNVISANVLSGLGIQGAGTDSNVVKGNIIGTDAGGTLDLGNGGDGIQLIDAANNVIGGTTAGQANLISGNQGDGIDISGANGSLYGGGLTVDFAGDVNPGRLLKGAVASATDLSFDVFTAYSTTTLFVKFVVRDDFIDAQAADAANPWMNDGIELFIDGDRAANDYVPPTRVGGREGFQLVADSAGNKLTAGAGLSNGDWAVTTSPSAGGYTIEFQIPLAMIDTEDGPGFTAARPGANLRLNAAVTDNDALVSAQDTYGILWRNGSEAPFATGEPAWVVDLHLADGTASGSTAPLLLSAFGRGNTVYGNTIGADLAGNAAVPNTGDGIRIGAGAAHNSVGGIAAGAGNVVSGNNAAGIRVEDLAGVGNLIQGNYVGLNVAGTAPVGNASHGIFVTKTGQLVGGSTPGAGNVVSGNAASGIFVSETGVVIQGNYIGTNAVGTAAVANLNGGIQMFSDADDVVIGGLTATPGTGAGNVISGNANPGIIFHSSGQNNNIVVQGNIIGLNASGTAVVGNGTNGVNIRGTNHTIGGTAPGARNIISGNGTLGIQIQQSGTTGNVVQGNYIGTDITGTLDLGNTTFGILINSDASGNTIGGLAPGARNIIAGNNSSGISITGANDNEISSNHLGVLADGVTLMPNATGGGSDLLVAGGVAAVRLGGVITAGQSGINVAASTIVLGHGADLDLSTASAGITLDGAVVLNNFASLSTTRTGPGADISITGALSKTANQSFAAYSGLADQTYGGNVTVADLTLSGGDAAFAGNLTAARTGAGTASITVAGDVNLVELTIGYVGGMLTSTGHQTYSGAVLLSGSATLSSATGDVIFLSTIDSHHNYGFFTLTVNSPGVTTFAGDIGSSRKLVNLITDAPGTTFLGGNITTGDDPTFNDAVILIDDVTITDSGAGIKFLSTVDSDAVSTPRALTLIRNVPAGGNAASVNVLAAPIGALRPLASLTTLANLPAGLDPADPLAGKTLVSGGFIATVNDLVFNDTVELQPVIGPGGEPENPTFVTGGVPEFNGPVIGLLEDAPLEIVIGGDDADVDLSNATVPLEVTVTGGGDTNLTLGQANNTVTVVPDETATEASTVTIVAGPAENEFVFSAPTAPLAFTTEITIVAAGTLDTIAFANSTTPMVLNLGSTEAQDVLGLGLEVTIQGTIEQVFDTAFADTVIAALPVVDPVTGEVEVQATTIVLTGGADTVFGTLGTTVVAQGGDDVYIGLVDEADLQAALSSLEDNQEHGGLQEGIKEFLLAAFDTAAAAGFNPGLAAAFTEQLLQALDPARLSTLRNSITFEGSDNVAVLGILTSVNVAGADNTLISAFDDTAKSIIVTGVARFEADLGDGFSDVLASGFAGAAADALRSLAGFEDALAAGFAGALSAAFDDVLAGGFADDLAAGFDDALVAAFGGPVDAQFADALYAGFEDALAAGFEDELLAGFDDAIAAAFEDVLGSGFDDLLASGFDDALAIGFEDELAAGFEDALTAGFGDALEDAALRFALDNDLTLEQAQSFAGDLAQSLESTAGFEDALTAGFEDLLAAGFESRLPAGFEDELQAAFDDLLVAGFDDTLAAGFEDALEAGFDDLLEAGFEDALEAGFDDALEAGFEDVLAAGFDDMLQAAFQGALAASQFSDELMSGFEDELLAGFEDALAAGFADALEAGFEDELQAGFVDALAAGFEDALQAAFEDALAGGFDDALSGGFDDELAAGFVAALRAHFEDELAGGFDDVLASAFDDALAAAFDDALAAAFDDALAAGFEDELAQGFEDALLAGFEDLLAAGFDDALAAGFDDMLAAGFDDVLAGGFEDALAGGFEDVLGAGFDAVLQSGFDDLLAAGFEDELAAGFEDELAAGFDDVLDVGFDDVLEAGFEDMLAAGFTGPLPPQYADTAALAAFEDEVLAGFEDALVAGFEDELLAGFDDALASAFDDLLAAGFNGALAAGFEDALAGGFEDALQAGFEDALQAGFDDALAAAFDDVLAAGFTAEQAQQFEDALSAGFDDLLAAGFLDDLAAGFEDELAAGFDDLLAGGFEDLLSAGFDDVLGLGFDDMLQTGFDDLLAAGFEDELAGGFEDDLAAGFDDVLAGGFDDSLAAGFEDFLTAGFADLLASGYADEVLAAFEDALAAGFEDELLAGFDDALAAAFDDILLAGFDDVLAGGFEDALAAGFEDELVAGFEDALQAAFEDALAAGFDEALQLGFSAAQAQHFEDALAGGFTAIRPAFEDALTLGFEDELAGGFTGVLGGGGSAHFEDELAGGFDDLLAAGFDDVLSAGFEDELAAGFDVELTAIPDFKGAYQAYLNMSLPGGVDQAFADALLAGFADDLGAGFEDLLAAGFVAALEQAFADAAGAPSAALAEALAAAFEAELLDGIAPILGSFSNKVSAALQLARDKVTAAGLGQQADQYAAALLQGYTAARSQLDLASALRQRFTGALADGFRAALTTPTGAPGGDEGFRLSLTRGVSDQLAAGFVQGYLETFRTNIVLEGGNNVIRGGAFLNLTMTGGNNFYVGELSASAKEAIASVLADFKGAVAKGSAAALFDGFRPTVTLEGDNNIAQAGMFTTINMGAGADLFIERVTPDQIQFLQQALAGAASAGDAVTQAILDGFRLDVTLGDGDDIAVGGILGRFDGGAGDDRFIIEDPALLGAALPGGAAALLDQFGGGAFRGGLGNDAFNFVGAHFGNVVIEEEPAAGADTSVDSLNFSSFAGDAIAIDLAQTGPQTVSAGKLFLDLSSAFGVENIVGTSGADTILGNDRDNELAGADFRQDDRITTVLGWNGRSQVVYLDFSGVSTTPYSLTPGQQQHAYTDAEKQQIVAVLEQVYAGFHFSFTLTEPAAGQSFTRVIFNETPNTDEPPGHQGPPLTGSPGGHADEVDLRNANFSTRVVVDINGFLGGFGQPANTSENAVKMSAILAAHEIGHAVGLVHSDALSPLGHGIHLPPGPGAFLPDYPGLVQAFETTLRIMASPASVGSTLFDVVNMPFFGERELIKLALAESWVDSGPTPNLVYETPAGNDAPASAQTIGALPGLAVPNTMPLGWNAGKTFDVAAMVVAGHIGPSSEDAVQPLTGAPVLDPDTQLPLKRSESDYYAFRGRAGDLLNLQVLSVGMTRLMGNTIDPLVRVYGPDGQLMPYYGGLAVNDDDFDGGIANIVDLVLPSYAAYADADGNYTFYVEVDSFTFQNNPAFTSEQIAGFLGDPARFDGLHDTDQGDYELFIYRFSAYNAADGDDLFSGRGGDNVIVGGSGADTILEEGDVHFSLTSAALVGPGVDQLKDIEHADLKGGTGANAFTMDDWAGTAAFDGKGGFDTFFNASDTPNVWHITGADAGDLNGLPLSFSGMEVLKGGADTDVFVFSDGASVSGGIDGGGGYDTLDYHLYTTAVSVNQQTHQATGIGGLYSGIEQAIGGQNSDTLTGADATNAWHITENNGGSIGGAFDFHGFENLAGGADNDTFTFADGKGIAGSISGQAGYDTLDYHLYAGAVAVNRQTAKSTGIGGLYSGIEQAIGGQSFDSLTGADVQNAWHITEQNGGSIGGLFDFHSFENLTGGAANDAFILSDGKGLAGRIDGAAGSNTLDYSAYTTQVIADLSAGAATNIGGGLALLFQEAPGSPNNRSTIQNLTGGAASDIFVGDAQDNVFFGRAGSDHINGLAGDDVFVVGNDSLSETDTVVGGAGRDSLDFRPRSSAGIVLDFSIVGTSQAVSGQASGGDYRLFLTDDLENAYGTMLADQITGNALSNLIVGDPFDPTNPAAGGDDILVGADGDDVMLGHGGNDHLTGSNGNDVLVGGLGADRLVGSAGHDILMASDISGVFEYHAGDYAGLEQFHLQRWDDNFALLRALGNAWASQFAAEDLAAAEQTGDDIIDELSQDVLTGSSGSDWFILQLSDIITDDSALKAGDKVTYTG